MLEGTSLPSRPTPSLVLTGPCVKMKPAGYPPWSIFFQRNGVWASTWIIHHFSLLPPNFPSLPLRFLVVLT